MTIKNFSLKRFVPALIVIFLLGIAGYGLTSFFMKSGPFSQKDKSPEFSVPVFTFTDVTGKTYESRNFRGKIVIFNFWASWCPPCVEEFPLLLDIAQEYKEDVVLIMFSSDHDKNAMFNFLKKVQKEHKVKLGTLSNVILALDEKSAITRTAFQAYRLPDTLITDRKLIIRDRFVGAEWTKEELEAVVNRLK